VALETKNGEGDASFSEINITPLTDVFLVLLAIFLVTGAALAPGALEVSLPETRSAPVAPGATRTVSVAVDRAGRLSVDGRATTPERLENDIRAALAVGNRREVLLAGDKDVALGRAVLVLDAARRAGAERASLATSPGGAR
jgi:biopolymer transport protein ExbD